MTTEEKYKLYQTAFLEKALQNKDIDENSEFEGYILVESNDDTFKENTYYVKNIDVDTFDKIKKDVRNRFRSYKPYSLKELKKYNFKIFKVIFKIKDIIQSNCLNKLIISKCFIKEEINLENLTEFVYNIRECFKNSKTGYYDCDVDIINLLTRNYITIFIEIKNQNEIKDAIIAKLKRIEDQNEMKANNKYIRIDL